MAKIKTLDEAIAELKARYAEKERERAEIERKKQALNAENIETVKSALNTLLSLTPSARKEIASAVKRLEMFVAGERYTRRGGNE